MAEIANQTPQPASPEAPPRRPLPAWLITTLSVIVMLAIWQALAPWINPAFGSYPSQIAESFVDLAASGKLWAALIDSLRPFLLGYGLAILIGVPLGLVIGSSR